MPIAVGEAKEVARQWVKEEGARLPGFCGAYFHGSTNWLPEDAILLASSDVDVMVVLATPDLLNKPGKFLYQDVLLEVSYLSTDLLESPEKILGQYQIVGSFRSPGIIADPSGQLAQIQAVVSREYAKQHWVRKRCEQARNRILTDYSLNNADPLHSQVTAWLFSTGITTHILLVAGLKNPTVRRRYLAARELLAEYDCQELYPALLERLGCLNLSHSQVKQHLLALAEAFDAASAVVKTPFFFASDISQVARSIAIDGSQELIDQGDHREAIFWMVATYSRCLMIFYADAPLAMQERYTPGFRALLHDLGIASFTDLQQRKEQLVEFLPRVWDVAEAIMAANPEIEA